jgi:hypothetical protein
VPLHGLLDDGPQPVAFTLPAEQTERGVDDVIAHHDQAVAREELGAFAVGRQERPLITGQSLRTVDVHTLARHQLGQRVDLSFDAVGPFAIDVDQPLSLVSATEAVAFRQ